MAQLTTTKTIGAAWVQEGAIGDKLQLEVIEGALVYQYVADSPAETDKSGHRLYKLNVHIDGGLTQELWMRSFNGPCVCVVTKDAA